MAENTRLKDLQSEMRKAFDAIEAHNQSNVAMGSRLTKVESHLSALQLSLDSIAHSLEKLTSGPPVGALDSSSRVASPSAVVPPLHMLHVKLDFPRFDGSNPLDWIFRAEQYFAYYHTPDVDRLTIASVNFEGVVIPWFQLLQRANQLPTWTALVTAIELQFGPSPFDSPRARLFKLSQTSSVVEYYNEFLLLANRSQGLTEATLLDCFISGLKDPIRRDVLAQSPCTVLKAVSLARLFDEKATLGLSVPHNRPTSYSTFKANPHSGTSSLQKSNSSSPNALPPILPTPLTKASPPVRRISPAEQQLRREKGLCFTCDAKYTWNHKCPNK